jgi:hypothetical protein
MQIIGSRKRSISKLTAHLDKNKDVFVYSVTNNSVSDFLKVGFTPTPKIGDSILPNVIGPISKFNAEGKNEPDKTKPMVTQVIGQKYWSWEEWHGRQRVTQERAVDDTREVYQRKITPPPALEMQILDVSGQLRLVTGLSSGWSDIDILHAVNLYLEYFAECHVTDDPKSVPIVTPTRVNWRFLPPGQSPWARVQGAVASRTQNASSGNQWVVIDRQKFICSLNPDDVYVGEGGFSDYLAYVFNAKGLVVLESLLTGNAIYIFGQNWVQFSQITKSQLIQQGLYQHRIIHATGWKKQIRGILI